MAADALESTPSTAKAAEAAEAGDAGEAAEAAEPAETAVAARPERVEPESRAACAVAVRAFRPRRTLPAAGTALALTMIGILAANEIATLREHGRTALDRFVWADPPVRWVGAAGLALGLLLLLLALVPGRGRVVPLRGAESTSVSGLTRDGLRQMLAAAAAEVHGVDRVRVRLRGRLRPRALVRVRVGTGGWNPAVLTGQVREAVRQRLDELRLVRPPRVMVRSRWRRGDRESRRNRRERSRREWER